MRRQRQTRPIPIEHQPSVAHRHDTGANHGGAHEPAGLPHHRRSEDRPQHPRRRPSHTAAGAEAFTRYFIERWNVAWTGPRAGILSPLCQGSALACTAFESTATRLAKEGHRYNGDPVSVKFIGVLDQTGANQLGVLANLVQERRSEIDASGRTILTDKREDFRLHFQLVYAAQTWSVLSTKVMK